MEIRVTRESDIPQLKKLWREVFDDEGIYTELFFKYRYETTEGIGLFDGDRLLSALYLLPCTFKVKDKEYKMSYIFAVATFKEERCRGYSKKVLKFAHEYLKEKGYDAASLVPAEESLFNFYKNSGYMEAFYASFHEHITVMGNKDFLEKADLASMINLREDYFSSCDGFLSWDRSALKFCQIDNDYSHGEILKFPSESYGYAVCSYFEDLVLIKELICDDSKRGKIINAIGSYFGKRKVVVRDVPKGKKKPFGMIYLLSEKIKNEYREGSYVLSLPMD